MSYNAKNHTEQGGEKTVIGGTLEILSGATIVADEGATVEGFGGGDGGYVLPAATSAVLGGIKVGSGLSVTEDGTLSLDGPTPAAAVAESEATDVAGVNTVLNAVIAALKAAGLMASDE